MSKDLPTTWPAVPYRRYFLKQHHHVSSSTVDHEPSLVSPPFSAQAIYSTEGTVVLLSNDSHLRRPYTQTHLYATKRLIHH